MDIGIISDEESLELQNKTMVGNMPHVLKDKIEKLQWRILNIFSEIGAVDRFWMPVNPNTKETLSYCFIEFNTHQEAEFAKEKINGQRLGKMLIYMFYEIEKLINVLEEWALPETKPYTPEENLQKWLSDEKRRDQFVICACSVTKVLWNDASQSLTDLFYNKRWSPMRTYLDTVQRQGVAIWGGVTSATTLNRLVELIDFSPGETFLLTYSSHVNARDSHRVVVNIFDVRTKAIIRGFKGNEFVVEGTRGVGGVSWPVFRWGGGKDEKCFARTRKNVVSVYETRKLTLIDKKSIKVGNVIDPSWSPTDPIFAPFVPQQGRGNQPARHGTTIVFALWPDHISVVSDGRGTTEHVEGYEPMFEGYEPMFNHVCTGNEEKLRILGTEHIVSLAGVCKYSENAFKKLNAEIGFGKNVEDAVQHVYNDYVRDFKKDDDDSDNYTSFPAWLYIVGFDEMHTLEKEFVSYRATIGGKDVKFLFCGSGYQYALDHLEDQLNWRKSEIDNIHAVSELLVECVAVSSMFDPCSGGAFQKIEFRKGGMPYIFPVRPHLITQIAKVYEHVDYYLQFTILIIAPYHPDLDFPRYEYDFQKSLTKNLPRMNGIQVLGVNRTTNMGVRLIFFQPSDEHKAAVKEMLSMDRISDYEVFFLRTSKKNLESIMNIWNGDELL